MSTRTFHRFSSLFFLIAIASSLACSTSSRVDEHFGDAVRHNKELMIANPHAGSEPDDGVTDLEGTTVENALNRYRREQNTTQQRDLPSSILIQGMPSSR